MDDTGDGSKAPTVISGAATIVAPPVADKGPSEAARIIDEWKTAHLRNTPFSRNTAAWNTLEKALPALIAAFEEVL